MRKAFVVVSIVSVFCVWAVLTYPWRYSAADRMVAGIGVAESPTMSEWVLDFGRHNLVIEWQYSPSLVLSTSSYALDVFGLVFIVGRYNRQKRLALRRRSDAFREDVRLAVADILLNTAEGQPLHVLVGQLFSNAQAQFREGVRLDVDAQIADLEMRLRTRFGDHIVVPHHLGAGGGDLRLSQEQMQELMALIEDRLQGLSRSVDARFNRHVEQERARMSRLVAEAIQHALSHAHVEGGTIALDDDSLPRSTGES